MTNFKMKFRFLAIAAAFLCCLSCVEVNYKIGGNMIPITQMYDVYVSEAPIPEVYTRMADSLSGYSSTRVTIGAVRDAEYGLTTRSCALTLVPMFLDSLDMGKNPVFKKMHMSIAKDTCSIPDPSQEVVFQNVNVYELARPIDAAKDFDCNSTIPHLDKRITKGTPVYNGQDSLSFNFTKEFGEKFLALTNDDVQDIDDYFKKIPGIYIDVDPPASEGGRINLFDLQMEYDSDYYYLEGNFAYLNFESEYDGERKDTTMFFFLGAYEFDDLDSLLTSASTFPQYCLNYTGHETREMAGKAEGEIKIEGGGGLKPYIKAQTLRDLAIEMISAAGGDPSTAVINKASIVLPFEFPDDYKDMDRFWPDRLSPTCRILTDTTAVFSSLSDSSSDYENQGDVNRSLCEYAPDISYHLQQLIRIDPSDTENKQSQYFNEGMYDIWFLIMADEVYTEETETNDEMSEYYNYLAYQSYYSSMYGGYSSYGSSYSNYYTYMMLAQYASSSSSYETTSTELDRDRFYKAALNGPAFASDRVPTLKLTFSLPCADE